VDHDALLPTIVYMVYILVITEICHTVGPDIYIDVDHRLGVRRYSMYFMLMD
jgi:hypothetical protein